jgi:starvation-inducible DNA-binding protein
MMEQLIQNMKHCLGTVVCLYFKTHSYHFNIEGIHFPSLHPFFEEQYKILWKSIDDFGEQIRQLNAYAPSSLARMIELSKIEEQPHVPTAPDMILDLLENHGTMIALLTETFQIANKENKQGLANFLAERLEAHTKMQWMLRATSKIE